MSRDVGGGGFSGVAQAAASRRTATGRTKDRRVTRAPVSAMRSRSPGGRFPHLHGEARSPDADGGPGQEAQGAQQESDGYGGFHLPSLGIPRVTPPSFIPPSPRGVSMT